MRHLLSRISALFHSQALDRDFDQELESHLAMLTDEYVRRGMTPEEAARAARLHFGGVSQLRESHRAVRGLPLLDTFVQDARYALRTLRLNPGFTALAVVTLAIGIGVNAAVFTLFDAAALRPLPVAEPHRLMQLTHTGRDQFFSNPEFQYYRDHSRSFMGLVAMNFATLSMSGVAAGSTSPDWGLAGAAGLRLPRVVGGSEPVAATMVSADYFRVLGVGAIAGRTFAAGEDSPGAPPVAMLSENFWQRRFGRDPALLGRTITLNGSSATIVGITAHDFGGTWAMVPDLWVPLTATRNAAEEGALCCRVYGRLRAGIAPAQAAQELDVLAGNRPGPPHLPIRFVVGEASAGGRPRRADDFSGALPLLAGIGVVLLIACANVASLLLARSAARQREIAIRLAIGAGRGRLIRQLLTENAALSLLAGGVGMICSWWTVRFLLAQGNAILSNHGSLALEVKPDYRVIAYIVFLSVLSTFVFGLAPALEASRPSINSGLRDEGAAFGGRLRKSRLRSLMVGTQVALCLALLITAGLLARSSMRTETVDLGFDYRNLVSLDIEFPRTASAARIASTRAQLAQELRRLPEIQSLAVASRMPLVHGNMRQFAAAPDGGQPDLPGTPDAWYALVTPAYFDTLRIPIVRGRNFTTQEAREGTNYDGSPVIVSEATARHFWPGEDPIGKRMSFGPRRTRVRRTGDVEVAHSASSFVIGVARDVRAWRLEMVDPTCVYLPVTNSFGGVDEGVIAMRTNGGEGSAVAALRRFVQDSHPDLQVSIGDERTALSTQNAFLTSRLGAVGAAIVGLLGLLMTSVGIYGTVGFAVSRRTQEIGIRMALGAGRVEVLALVLAETMRPVLVGMAVGLAFAAAIARVMHSILFGISALDPASFLGVSAFLAAVALLAGYVPATRATRVDPVIALRSD